MLYLVETLSPSLVVVRIDSRPFHGSALWCECYTRKPVTCFTCKNKLGKSYQVFRPYGNLPYRYLRVCGNCIEKLIKNKELEIQDSGGG